MSARPNELQRKLQKQWLTHEHVVIRNLRRMQEVPGSWGNASRVPSFRYNLSQIMKVGTEDQGQISLTDS